MGLKRKTKRAFHKATSIILLYLAVTEMIAILTITLITWTAVKNNDITGGIETFMYWFVRFLISQIIIMPFLWVINWLHWKTR